RARARSPARASRASWSAVFSFLQAEDGIRAATVTGVQTCALPISGAFVDRLELLRRAEAILAQRLDAGEVLAFEPGHADHVEFEIGRASCRERVEIDARCGEDEGRGEEREQGALA